MNHPPRHPLAPPPAPIVAAAVERALLEDLIGGDVTTEATVPTEQKAEATAYAKAPLLVCGFPVFAEAFRQVDGRLEVRCSAEEGAWVEAGTPLWRVQGDARSILAAERTALNFAQRLSGIATLAHRYLRAVPVGSRCRIVDTRKTTPGLRPLERYAVRAGGAHNHRDNLGAAVLIKDNHIAAAGGIRPAIRRARERAAHTSKIEVEVESLSQLDEALAGGADIIMLDNFQPDQIAEAVGRCQGKALTEASGGVTLERIPELARAGVDAISVGALTHSAPAADISLKLKRQAN